jgi:quinol-cytochrome oxidoreductase complex cytochrome b subunit
MVLDAPLEDPADPGHTPNPAKAPWYFVGLQELLVYFDPWLAGVGIGFLIVFGLGAIPYLDPTRHDQGVYTLRRRPLANGIFLAGLVGWFVLIAIGLWMRGPGWAWVLPGQASVPAAPATAAYSFPDALGAALVLAYFAGGGLFLVRRTASRPGFTRTRRWIFALLLLAMAGTLLKVLLNVLFHVRYVVRFESLGLNL